MSGYRPTKKTVSAIKDFPTPQNITDIRAWFGIVNQVAYTFSQKAVMAPFRDLLSSKKKLYWDEAMDHAFHQSKEEIIRLVHEGVQAFEVDRPTCLSTDWAKIGLGFALM